MRRIAVFVCSFGYVGFFPVAPGTAGSAAGLALLLLLRGLGGMALELPVAIGLFAVGVWLGARAEEALGSIDPGPVVIDEVVGMLLTVALIPLNWVGLTLGFLIFRVLDVFKPYPAKRLERWPGGLGMMADDALVAVYGNLLLHVVSYAAPGLVS